MSSPRRAAPRFEGLTAAFAAALDFRLLTLWVLGTLAPTLIAALPIWRFLGSALDLSPLSPDLARRFDMLVFDDLMTRFRDARPAHEGCAIAAVGCFALISPLLTAAILATAENGRSNGFVELLQRTLAWYGRTLRLWLMLLMPIALLVGSAIWLMNSAGSYAENATLESRASLASQAALAVLVLLGVLLHATAEAGRAELVASPWRRSVSLAWLSGVRKALAQPLETLVRYLAPSALGLCLAALLLAVRVHVPAAGRLGFVAGAVTAQFAVAAIGWGHASRLFALSRLFRPVVETS
jgi:hypothetical protein